LRGISRRRGLGWSELEAIGGVLESAPVSCPGCAASANEVMVECNGIVVPMVKWTVVLLSLLYISSPRLQRWGRAAETAVKGPSEKRPALSHRKEKPDFPTGQSHAAQDVSRGRDKIPAKERRKQKKQRARVNIPRGVLCLNAQHKGLSGTRDLDSRLASCNVSIAMRLAAVRPCL
jgi:hypothetical protein